MMKISAAQSVALGQTSAIKISLQDLTNELTTAVCLQDWYFDSATLLPIRVDFLASEAASALSNIRMTYLFSNYQNVSGVQIPFLVTTLADGQQIEQITFSSVAIGATVPTTDFDAPSAATGSAQ